MKSGFNKNFSSGEAGLSAGGNNTFKSGEKYSGSGGGNYYANSVPVAYWDISDSSGTTLTDVSSAGNNLNGTFGTGTGAPSFDTSNKVRGARSLLFNGQSSDRDVVLVPDNNALDFNVNDAFSISCWVRRTGDIPSGAGAWVAKMAQASSHGDGVNEGYYFGTPGTAVQRKASLFLRDNTGGEELLYVETTNTVLNDTNFHNVLVTYNGNSDSSGVKIYVDGTSVPLTQQTDTLEIDDDILTSTDLSIGAMINNTINNSLLLGWEGNMDEIAIWSKELSSDEVTAVYNGGSGVDVRNGIPDE